MTEKELIEARHAKWRLNGEPVRTIEDARAFLESVGFCLMYPLRPAVPLPTFLGAFVGSEDRLPTWQHAYKDPRAKQATELMVRLLREKAAFEANLFGETNFLIAESVFPYFYALEGDRNPKQDAKLMRGNTRLSPLAHHAFTLIRDHGATAKPALLERLGGALSAAALDRALLELWSALRIIRVDYNPREGAYWDVLYRWAPEPVKQGIRLSIGESLSALISKYLESMVAAEQDDVEVFFGHMVPRSKVKEMINALLAARELQYVMIGKRSLLQMAPPPSEAAPRERRRNV